ncbi:MAG: hypothetical protein ACRDNF_08960 [Streptosporangiaceae bacterium]
MTTIVDHVATGGETPGPDPARPAARHGPASGAAAISLRWRAAESHLYPLIMSDPELYELAVTLVVEVREVLRRRCPTISALIDADPAAVLAGCPSARAVGDRGFDPVTAFHAACAHRSRELAGTA